MKKRKELDALLGKRCRSYQQLKSNEAKVPVSSSSNDVYFHPATNSQVASKKFGRSIKEKNSSCSLKRCFYFSLPLCLLALITACITSSIGVVWMQMQLKSDIDQIKDRMLKLEQWKNDQVSSLNDVQESLGQLHEDVTGIKEGESGIQSLHNSLSNLAKKVNYFSTNDISLAKKNFDMLNESWMEAAADISRLEKSMKSYEHSSVVLNQQLAFFNTALAEVQADLRIFSIEVNNRLSHENVSTAPDLRPTLKQIDNKLNRLEQSNENMEVQIAPLVTRHNELIQTIGQLALQCANCSQHLIPEDTTTKV